MFTTSELFWDIKGRRVPLPTFRENVTVPYSKVKESFILEDGTDTLSQNSADIINIQGDSGGIVTILAGYIMGPCEKKKVYINMCLILNGYRERNV
jgi:hypothetical protein